jgi:signal transduction histidine kinase
MACRWNRLRQWLAQRVGNSLAPWLLLTAGVALAVQGLGARLPLDAWVYDSGQALVRRAPPDDLRIVAIDGASLQRVGRWPWSRSTQAQLVNAICAAQPLALGVDIADTEPSAGDAELAPALRHCGMAVLPVLLEQAAPGANWHATLPVPELATAAAALGRVNVELGSDGAARGVMLQAGIGPVTWPLLVQQVLRLAGQLPAAMTTPTGTTAPMPTATALPSDSPGGTAYASSPTQPHQQGKRLLNFWGPPGSLPVIPAWKVLDGQAALQLHGKIVLLGATAAGLGDLLAVPNAGNRLMPGVEVLATVLLDMRHGLLVRPISPWPQTLLTLLLALLPWLWLPRLQVGVGLLASFAWVLALLLGAALLPGMASLWFAPAGALVGALASHALWALASLRAAQRHLDAQILRLDLGLPPHNAAPLRRPSGSASLEQRPLLAPGAARRFFMNAFKPWQRLRLSQRIALIEQAQSRMQAVQQQREEALRFIAHDVRVPLAAAADMLDGPPLDAAEQARLARQVQRAHQLAEGFLLLTRVETPQPLKLQSIELGGLLDQAADALDGALQRAGVKLRRQLGDGPVWVLGDFALLERAAVNLLRNAVQHSATGAEVVLGLVAAQGHARWWVSDAGPGLDAQQQAQLFQRHMRLDTQPSRTAGFGLGLYFVRLVAEKLGGSVGVESAPGAGATFWMRLPLEPG